MKPLPLLAVFLLTSCARDIAGLTLQDRLKFYGLASCLYGQPIEITLEGPEPK